MGLHLSTLNWFYPPRASHRDLHMEPDLSQGEELVMGAFRFLSKSCPLGTGTHILQIWDWSGQQCPSPAQPPWRVPSTLLVNSPQHPLHACRAFLTKKNLYPHSSVSVRCPPARGALTQLLLGTPSGTDLLRGSSSRGDEYVHPMVSHSQLQDLRKQAGYSALLKLGREPAARKSGPVHPRHRAGGAQEL